MYLTHLEFRNWRNFTQGSVSFKDTAYLIGPNASGKSNFLDIFRFMRDIVNPRGGGLQQALASRGGLSKVLSLAGRKAALIELDFELRDSLEGGDCWRYTLEIGREKGRKHRPVVVREEASRNGTLLFSRPDDEDTSDPERMTQTHLEQINMNVKFREIAKFFEQVLYLHLVPQLLKYGDQVAQRNLESDPYGQGFLDEIARARPRTRDTRLKTIEGVLQKVIPNLAHLQFVKDAATGRPHLEMTQAHWRAGAGWQREDQFSDGTLRLIAMLWALLSAGSMVLLEEPELSLHTGIVEQIPDMIYKVRQSRKKPVCQILISTHSAEILSNKSIAGEFLILTPGSHGQATTIQEPSESDKEAMISGMPPAEILVPPTRKNIQRI